MYVACLHEPVCTTDCHRYWTVEDGHALCLSLSMGRYVGFFYPVLQGGLEDRGHRHSRTSHVSSTVCLYTARMAHVIVVGAYSHRNCLSLLHVLSLAAEVTHIDRAFKLLGIFHKIRRVHVCVHIIDTAMACPCDGHVFESHTIVACPSRWRLLFHYHIAVYMHVYTEGIDGGWRRSIRRSRSTSPNGVRG